MSPSPSPSDRRSRTVRNPMGRQTRILAFGLLGLLGLAACAPTARIAAGEGIASAPTNTSPRTTTRAVAPTQSDEPESPPTKSTASIAVPRPPVTSSEAPTTTTGPSSEDRSVAQTTRPRPVLSTLPTQPTATSAPRPTTRPTTPTTSPPTTTASELVGCTAPGLLVTIEARPAAMGSRYLAIVTRNTTRHRCVIAGHPTVRAVDSLGQPVGSDATPEDIASRPIVMAPDATAQALVQVVRAGVLDPGRVPASLGRRLEGRPPHRIPIAMATHRVPGLRRSGPPNDCPTLHERDLTSATRGPDRAGPDAGTLNDEARTKRPTIDPGGGDGMFVRWLELATRSRAVAVTIAVAVILGIGAVDVATGDLVSLRYLYLVPIMIIAWATSRPRRRDRGRSHRPRRAHHRRVSPRHRRHHHAAQPQCPRHRALHRRRSHR